MWLHSNWKEPDTYIHPQSARIGQDCLADQSTPQNISLAKEAHGLDVALQCGLFILRPQNLTLSVTTSTHSCTIVLLLTGQ